MIPSTLRSLALSPISLFVQSNWMEEARIDGLSIRAPRAYNSCIAWA